MLTQRALHLHSDGGGLYQPLIMRETLEDCGRAEAVLDRARKEAQRILQHADEEREVLLDQAREAFMQEADAQLRQWERERLEMWSSIEQKASAVVQEAIAEMLGDLTDRQRLDAMIRQLVSCHSEPIKAVLHCHPERMKELEALLGESEKTPWRPVANTELAMDELRLLTDNGEFRIDWSSMVVLMTGFLQSE